MGVLDKLFCSHDYQEISRYYKCDFNGRFKLKAFIEEKCNDCKKIRIRKTFDYKFNSSVNCYETMKVLGNKGFIDKTFE